MNKSILKTLTITAALTGILSISAFSTSIGGATIEASALNLRSTPSTTAPIISTSPRGAVVVVGENRDDGWLKVVYRGATGYMSSEYLSFSETLNGTFGKGKIFGDDVRIRENASLASVVLGTYDNDTEMQVLGVSGGWYKVSYNGVTGYVFSDYFCLSRDLDGASDGSKPGQTIPTSSVGQTIVDTAKKYISTPYVWAGTSPRGFDCSGFVYYVFKECGYSTNRTAASIYQNGTAVDRSDLQIGDAICFGSSANSIGHVGIYIGDGEFIHASSGSGYVKIDKLSSSYYDRNYFGARRIV